MSYQVLARKWRPRIFREMVGQEHVLRALINALDHKRLHHAYLFTGTRGVGKTTIARILAKCLNCEVGISSEPCGECSACCEIAEGRFVDLIEVDAASRTKVEDTRDLLDNVQYLPSRGLFKIYLIDEVHMLSNSSFNALLKTLEEPPEHVKFLLATTDPHKLPVTILSRCLQFNLKNMSPERIVGHLQHVLTEELVPYDDGALWQLARAADGSMRDGLSLTDQAIAFGNGKIANADVASMLGTIDYQLIAKLVEALIKNDGKALLQAVASFAEHAPDFNGALGDLISLLHRIAIAQALPEALDNSFGDRSQILHFSRQLAPEDVQLFYQTALIGRRDLALSPDARAGFEMTLLRMLVFKPQGLVEVPQNLLEAVPAQEETVAAVTAAAQTDPANSQLPVDTYESTAAQPPAHLVVETPAAVVADAGHLIADAAEGLGDLVPQELEITEVKTELSAVVEASDSAKKSLAGIFNPSQLPGLTTAAQLRDNAKSRQKIVESGPAPLTATTIAGIPLEQLRPEHWPQLFQALNIRGVLQSTAANCVLTGREGNQLFFALDQDRGSLFEESHRQRLADILSDYFGTSLRVQIALQALEQEAQTPALVAQRKKEFLLQDALATLETDPLVNQLREHFAAELDINSIKIIERGAGL